MKIEQYKNEPFYNKLVILKDCTERLNLDVNINIEYYGDKADFILTFGKKECDHYYNFNFLELQEIIRILEVREVLFDIRIDINGGHRIAVTMR